MKRKASLGRDLIEERIKQSRVDAALKIKREMEDKMRLLDEKLRLLSLEKDTGPDSPIKKPPPKIQKKWLTEKDRQKWMDEWEQKRKEAEEFARKMGTMQSEIKKKTDGQLRMMEDKIQKEKEMQEKLQREQEEAEEKERKEEVKRKGEEFEAKRKERHEQITKTVVDGALHKKTYLYEKMTKEYDEVVQLTELEKRKKVIAEKRNIYQPIRKADFDQHEKIHEDNVKKLEEQLKKEREKAVAHDPKYASRVKKYKTMFSEVAVKASQVAKVKLDEEKSQKKEKGVKMLEYAKVAQESYPPVVSSIKAGEVKTNTEKTKKSPRRAASTKKYDSPLRQGSVGVKEEKCCCDSMDKGDHKYDTIPKRRVKSKTGKHGGDKEQTMKKIDYLSELRKHGIIRRSEDLRNTTDCDALLRDEEMSPVVKLAKVKGQLEVMEKNARKKEALINPKGGAKKFLEVENEVSDIYIKAIKAKLSLLEL